MTRKSLKVLIVEDDQEDYYITLQTLKEMQYFQVESKWVKNCNEGINFLKNESFDIALIDYRVGSDSGVELIRIATEHKVSMPLILLTGTSSGGIDTESIRAGAADYIPKSMLAHLFLERVIRFAIERKVNEVGIKRLNEELESKVIERTKELHQANNILTLEVDERIKIEKELKKNIKEKDILIREIHHRVKNNLQIVLSLLNLQLEKDDSITYRDLIQDLINRIKSMSLVHEQLYLSKDLTNVNFSEYLHQLSNYLIGMQPPGVANAFLVKDIQEDVFVSIDTIIPSGIIVNELFSNSIKHAFNGKNGSNKITLYLRNTEEEMILSVADNGHGITRDVLETMQTRSLGIKLIKLLARQLNAKIEVDSGKGTKFTIRVLKNNY